ncbi:MAG: chemotaxis protein CheW [Granulosicoccus sp.]
MSRYVLFEAADLKLAIPASQVKVVHEQLPVQSVEGTANWFLGLAVSNGRLLPVTDLGAFAGRQACSGRILELEPCIALAALKVDEVPGFSDALPVDATFSENSAESNCQHLVFGGKSVKDSGDEHYLIDVDALVQLPAFINIKETNS